MREAAQERRAERLKKRELPTHKRVAKRLKTTRGQASVLQSMGLYRPKKGARKPGGKAITAGRRKYIKSLVKKFSDYLSPEYLFVPVRTRSKPKRARLLKKAKEAGEETTRAGVMVKRQGDVRSARFSGENLVAVRVLKDRHGRKHTEKIITPLKSADEIYDQKARTMRAFKRAARNTKGIKDAFVRFYVEGRWGSIDTYGPDEFEQAWEKMLSYTNANKPGQQIAFIARIKFGISVPDSHKNKTLTRAEYDFLDAQRDSLEERAEDGDDDAIDALERIEAAEAKRNARIRGRR